MKPPSPIIPHLERVIEAETIEEIWSLHLAKMAEYGFDRLLYGFTRFRTSTSFGNADDLLVLSNHDERYLDLFVRSGLFNHAPMVNWAAANEGTCSWRLIDEVAASRELSDIEKQIVDLNFRYDIRAGYSISFRDVSVRAKGAIGLCARPGMRQFEVDSMWEEFGSEIAIINNITHLRITAMPFASSRRALTPRQREALEWVGDGKTMQDIATIMGLTPATVEKHLRLAREALDVETTAQAVLKASFQNQIFMLPE
ncbi:LuxR family transcriptional regulator [Defluviimonas sp. WL0024]|uniref:LuxR family transcriptional regulator n=2 Tax=Albidovulum TaxID=205889 RepID=A0ABT3J095_9RHOB|nr:MULTISPECIES: LuxR family transcriptional regulator [Defluviimonas]MCU9846852.1 LuxR family transcriptional regulator [Defluviimonas sp. WL0024]MCW3781111.1 LuxR family transcriptional regulator [Defluviimonas salinarum]